MADPRDTALAGEYVLGTLPLRERQAFEDRLKTDATLAAEAALWQSQFAALDDEFSPETPPKAVWSAIEARLFADAKPAGVAPIWRWLGIAATTAAAAMAVMIWLEPLAPPDGSLWISDMVSQDGSVRLAALYDESSGEMRVSVGGQPPAEGRDWELWLIQGDQVPISLGLMPREGKAAMAIPRDLRALVVEATFAITDEPAGGSGGVATGPIVAAAQLRRI